MRRTIAAVLMIGIVGAGCGSSPVLRMAGDNKVGIAMGLVPFGAPRSVGSIALCLTGDGAATITDVAIHDARGDIRVDAFAIRPNPFTRGLPAVGNDERTLAEIGGGFVPGATQQLEAVCPTREQADDETVNLQIPEFAIQVSMGSGDLAGGTGIEVTYRIGGGTHTSLIPYAIWLCASDCPSELPNGGIGS